MSKYAGHLPLYRQSRILSATASISIARPCDWVGKSAALLHQTLPAATGRTNSHLYLFEAGQATWGLPDPDFGSGDLPANKHTLWDVIEDTGRKTIHYIYDFSVSGSATPSSSDVERVRHQRSVEMVTGKFRTKWSTIC